MPLPRFFSSRNNWKYSLLDNDLNPADKYNYINLRIVKRFVIISLISLTVFFLGGFITYLAGYQVLNLLDTLYDNPSVRPFMPFKANDTNNFRKFDIKYEGGYHLLNVKGNEEKQMNEFWRKLFNDKSSKSVSDIVIHYEQIFSQSVAEAFLERSSNWIIPPIKFFSHKVNNKDLNGTHLCVLVTERLHGVFTTGGSNMILAVRGKASLDVGRSTDNMNGTYHVCARYYEQEIHAILTLVYYHYGAFRMKKINEDPTIRLFNEIITLDKSDTKKVLSSVPLPLDFKDSEDYKLRHHYSGINKSAFSSKENNISGYKNDHIEQVSPRSSDVLPILEKGAWVLHQKQWRLMYNNAIVAFNSPKVIQKCLMDYSSITLVGDSHLRYIFYYLLTYVTKPDPTWKKKMHFNMQSYKFNFKWKAVGRSFVHYLKDLRISLLQNNWEDLKYPKMKRGRLIVMSLGHHDVEIGAHSLLDKRVGPGLYYSEMRQSLLLLRDIVFLAKERSISLLWITHPPFPYSFSFHGNYRNNFVLAALNRWFLPQLDLLGIPVFNIFDQTFVHSDSQICRGHYLCVTPETGKAIGDAGKALTELFLSYICPADKL